IAIECGNRLANKCSVLDKDNKRIQHDLKQSNNDKEKLSKHTYQLINKLKQKPEVENDIYTRLAIYQYELRIENLINRIKHIRENSKKDLSIYNYTEKMTRVFLQTR
ncbi:29256_t:CDS:2, partial [Racocetra persica]